MKCPKDNSVLQMDFKQGVVGYCCNRCYGVFLTEKGVQAFRLNYETTVVEQLFEYKDTNKSSRACANCLQYMHVAYLEDIELDICYQCQGVWFDEDEAQLIVDRYGPQPPELSPLIELFEWFFWSLILIAMVIDGVDFFLN